MFSYSALLSLSLAIVCQFLDFFRIFQSIQIEEFWILDVSGVKTEKFVKLSWLNGKLSYFFVSVFKLTSFYEGFFVDFPDFETKLNLRLILEFVLAVDIACPSLDGVLRPIGEACDEIDSCTYTDDWSQTLQR